MSELPPADVIADATKSEAAPGLGFEEAAKALVPLADRVRNTITSINLIPLAKATPEQRAAVVTLREELERVRRDTATWIDAIDMSLRHAAVELGNAKQLPTSAGYVEVTPPRDDVKVDADAMRRELLEAAHNGGPITVEEVETIFKTVVEVKADGSKLNYFARNRGAELAEIIERHRTRIPGNPLSAKLRFVKRA